MIKLKLVRSAIGCSPKQRKVLEALGLRRMHMVKSFKDTAAIRGMVTKLQHMIKVVE
jgi:large subunit ribosomal protein L30